MKFIIFIAMILMWASCEKQEQCGVIDETCTTFELISAHRCPDGNGGMNAWIGKFEEREYKVRTVCSKQPLVDDVESRNGEYEKAEHGIPAWQIICISN